MEFCPQRRLIKGRSLKSQINHFKLRRKNLDLKMFKSFTTNTSSSTYKIMMKNYLD